MDHQPFITQHLTPLHSTFHPHKALPPFPPTRSLKNAPPCPHRAPNSSSNSLPPLSSQQILSFPNVSSTSLCLPKRTPVLLPSSTRTPPHTCSSVSPVAPGEIVDWCSYPAALAAASAYKPRPLVRAPPPRRPGPTSPFSHLPPSPGSSPFLVS